MDDHIKHIKHIKQRLEWYVDRDELEWTDSSHDALINFVVEIYDYASELKNKYCPLLVE